MKKYDTTTKKYVQEYLPSLKPTNITKREMLNWSSNAVSYRERQELNRDRKTLILQIQI